MHLSFEQIGAVRQAKQILEDAGLFLSGQSPDVATANVAQLQELFSGNFNDSSQSEIVGLYYVPQKPCGSPQKHLNLVQTVLHGRHMLLPRSNTHLGPL